MANNKKSQQVEINTDLAMDIEQILNGGFAPLTTFLDKESLDSVLENMRLPTGEIWPIPILFPKKNLIAFLLYRFFYTSYLNPALAIFMHLQSGSNQCH